MRYGLAALSFWPFKPFRMELSYLSHLGLPHCGGQQVAWLELQRQLRQRLSEVDDGSVQRVGGLDISAPQRLFLDGKGSLLRL